MVCDVIELGSPRWALPWAGRGGGTSNCVHPGSLKMGKVSGGGRALFSSVSFDLAPLADADPGTTLFLLVLVDSIFDVRRTSVLYPR